jgi:hypothetical protein
MSYITITGRWSDAIFLNVHATTESKIDNVKGRFYEASHMKMLLGYFTDKVSSRDILIQQLEMKV